MFSISVHFLLQISVWQISPTLTAGPKCDWCGVKIPVPHHVVSPPANSIHSLFILHQSNKWQHWCLSLTISSSLWALCCLLLFVMLYPEGVFCKNWRHDKREHSQVYRPYSSQRIIHLPATHFMTGWRARGSSPMWEGWSVCERRCTS